jgi:hypothetical protein
MTPDEELADLQKKYALLGTKITRELLVFSPRIAVPSYVNSLTPHTRHPNGVR